MLVERKRGGTYLVDALAVVAAELSDGAGGGGAGAGRGVGAVPLVGPVAAVVLLVAAVRLGDALGVLARELVRGASAVPAVALRPFHRKRRQPHRQCHQQVHVS